MAEASRIALPRIHHGVCCPSIIILAFYITVFSMRQDMCCEVSIHLGDDERDNQVKATGEKIQIMLGMTADEIISSVRSASCMWFMPNFTLFSHGATPPRQQLKTLFNHIISCLHHLKESFSRRSPGLILMPP